MVRLQSRPKWGTAPLCRRLNAQVCQSHESLRLHLIRIAGVLMIANRCQRKKLQCEKLEKSAALSGHAEKEKSCAVGKNTVTDTLRRALAATSCPDPFP